MNPVSPARDLRAEGNVMEAIIGILVIFYLPQLVSEVRTRIAAHRRLYRA